MHTNITIHLSVGDHVGGEVPFQKAGGFVGVLHIDHGDQRVELRAEDPAVLYELAVRVSSLAARLDAEQKTRAIARVGLASCREALNGDLTEDDDTRVRFEELVDRGSFETL